MPRNVTAKKIPGREPEKELVITRVFNASRGLVFKAWTDPNIIARWWGPNNFTTPFCKVDLRVGGTFHYCMRSPEGRNYWGKGVYREVVEPEKLVFTDVFSDESGNTVPPSEYGMIREWPAETLVTVTFAEQGGKTTLTLHTGVPEQIAERAGARQGWTESLDKLTAYLSKG